MKNIFKKNQIIITALAIMIAVAGYLNFSGTKLTNDSNTKSVTTNSAENEFADISEEDVLAENSLAVETEGTTGGEVALADIESLDGEDTALETTGIEGELAAVDGEDASTTDTPGEAVFTSTTSVGFAAQAKVAREQVRSQSKETLLEVINNTNISEEQKQDAINSMIALTDIAEREAASELLLEAKGFTDVVVSITGDTVEVVVNLVDITDAERAQIEDIVKRKTNIAAENIVITPYGVAE